MFLKKAEIFQFRNYDRLCLDLHSHINIFVGDNGAGKSSFLEALYCALRGKSFHSFVGSQFIQKNKESSKVCLTLKEKEGFSSLETSFFLADSRLKKELIYCGKKTSPGVLFEKFPCFVFTENSLKCIRQGPGERRSFIEDFFSFSWQYQAKSSFEKILRQKNQLLKDYRKALISESDFLSFLKAINEKFLIASYRLVQARLEVLDRLYSDLSNIVPSFFKEPCPSLSFSYLTEGARSLEKDSDILSGLREDLKKKIKQEAQAGACLSGPHRHEIKFLFDGEDSRVFCSKGQQRSYVLSLLLNHVQAFPKSLLFLDDVLLELDEKIEKKFLNFIEKRNCQIFLTSCKIISFKTERMSLFYVKEGRIERL